MSDITLAITGMTCAHCVRAVTQALAQVPGVIKAEVSLEPGLAVIHGEADVGDLINAVAREGYLAVPS
ncbi:MAG: heavy metal-binding protein [Halothiobacillus sp. 24-54-40]|jgi:copper chaperone|nr:cation transporter [Halothiobacillaceae bacterium]OYV47135.1 MAG: heavy metal-binding protein [Halothiobacillus sp. 20-53-49]OYY40828.1 MAG: heavy metal-binding protein [Halothiobacillus sp. 35-54-62]OYY55470.1 MAG: heavy metal-binding protein [Halothiobacillus sp. 28-55-5]OYZ85892.1 MAG: heavy metal-binding protein [Halothiobacillus sp. 24-54-40]OZA80144.1 MAG: heavy metal-binding protein [Halothiobacillus sp. 39-53-45]HQS03394.1 cation transporter [Halothiobacillus sp.]